MKKAATKCCSFIAISHPLRYSAFTQAASLETFRDAIFGCRTPSWALRMMTGCASLRASLATSALPASIASSTFLMNVRTRLNVLRLIVLRRSVCRIRFFADAWLAIFAVPYGCVSFGRRVIQTVRSTVNPMADSVFSFLPGNLSVTFACGRRNKCSGQTEQNVRCPQFWQHHNHSQDRAPSPYRKL